MIEKKTLKWLPKFVKLENELNTLLREAAQDGIKPFIRIHEDEVLMGKNVQSVEISLVLGKIIYDYVDDDVEKVRELKTGEFFDRLT